jgi:hypothetical protein
MPAIASSPVFAASIAAPPPLAMLRIGMLVHVRHVTGSFATARPVSARPPSRRRSCPVSARGGAAGRAAAVVGPR